MGKKSQEIPRQFAKLEGMGDPVEAYAAKSSLLVNSLLAGFFVLGSGAALLVASWIVWQRWGRYYPPVIFEAVWPWVVGSAISFGAAVLIVWRTVQNRKKAAVIYTNGFAISDRKGVRAWYWDQVDAVTANVIRHYAYGIPAGTSHTYTIQTSTGDKLVFNDSLKNIEGFFAHLENNTLLQRYQRLAEAYNCGHPVSFGPVSIGKKHGIQIGRKTYPWAEIEEVGIHKGILSIKKKNGGWFSGTSEPAGSIPNLQVLLSMISQIVGLKAGE